MTIKIDKFEDDSEAEKLVGLEVIHNGRRLIIDKRVTKSDNKTVEQYVSDALTAAEAEINAWKADIEAVGRTFDPSTGTFV
jgi:hypothetical protein